MRDDIIYFEFKTFDEMYHWLLENAKKEKELFVKISRQKPENCVDILSYYDAVKAALCFGWIDSTVTYSHHLIKEVGASRSMTLLSQA